MDATFKFTKDEVLAVKQVLEQIGESENSAIPVREIMVDFFLKHFPSNSRTDAEIIVDKIIKGTSTFTQYYDELKNEDEVKLIEKFNEAMKDLSLEDKYNCMLNFLVALKAVDSKLIADYVTEEQLDHLEKFEGIKEQVYSIASEDVTQETFDELIELAKEAIENSAVGIAGNPDIIELIKELPVNEEAAQKFALKNWDDAEFKNYSALAAYVAYLNGEIPSIPAETDPEIIAIGVAAGIERDKIINQARTGIITWEKAFKVLKIISGILLTCLIAWIALQVFLGILTVSIGLGAAIFGNIVIAALVGSVLGGFIAYKAASYILDNGVDLLSDIGDGYDKVTEYIRETIFPKIVDSISAITRFINEKVIRGVFKIHKKQKLGQITVTV
jgi:hypothetical protein